MGRIFFPNGNIYYKLIFKLFFSSRSGILRIISIMETQLPSRIGFPNYSQGTSLSSGSFIASQPLYIVITKNNAGNNSAYIQVNGSTVAALEGSSQGYNKTFGCAYVYTGDSITITLNNSICKQYPLR